MNVTCASGPTLDLVRISPDRNLDFGGAKRPATTLNAPPWMADVPAFTAFAHDVEDALEGPILRYSERQRLLKRAEHFGIRRFDANLIIAFVQSRAPRQTLVATSKIAHPLLQTAGLFLAIQSVIFAGVWWVFLR